MARSRCVGLLGGVGVGAAVHYYRQLARMCTVRGVEFDLVMVNAETPRVIDFVGRDDRDGLAAYLAGFLQRMKAAGAVCAVIPSVTTHFAMRELRAAGVLPILDIFAPLAEEVRRRGIRRVAVFGTRFVMSSGLYGFVPGLEFVMPQAEELEVIHDTYMGLAMEGVGRPEQYVVLRDLAHALCARERVDAIVLGGTDLSLIFDETNMDFPHLDCAALHVRAVEQFLFAAGEAG